METFFEDYFERMQTLYTDIKTVLEGLPPQALDWSPGPEMNSIAVLVTHLTGAARFWVGDVAAQEPSGRVRAQEFQVHGVQAADLVKKLDASLDYLRRALEGMKVEDLGSPRPSPRQEQSCSMGWALLHTLEHTGIHLGHLQVTRQLWESQQGA
jgi:uncharacterized damage-inducible protein DinB